MHGEFPGVFSGAKMHKALKAMSWLAGNKLILLAVAGAVGTLARYWLGGLVHRLCGTSFPWGTLTINVIGCLLFGIVWSLADERMLISPQARIVILTGFMGAFTTFSTFAFETAQMLADDEWLRAIGNVALENVVGVAAVFLGFAIGRFV
jgi:CrcB protein